MYNYLLYTSISNIDSYEELDKILIAAVKFNKSKNITGVLLFDDTYFLQILEGKKQDIDELYTKITKDPRHHGIHIKLTGELQTRNFPDWSMRLSLASRKSIEPLYDMVSVAHREEPENKNDLLRIIAILLSQTFAEYRVEHVNQGGLSIFSKLTQRELSILRLLIKGFSARAIGEQLNISHKTAANHIDNIRVKLGCETAKDVIRKVFESGYIMYLI